MVPKLGEHEFMVQCPEGVDVELFQWWMDRAYCDLAVTAPKVTEYGGTAGGSADLRIMGFVLDELLNNRGEESIGDELAIWLYLMGKMARLVSDYKANQPGQPDTLLDITVYSFMARRIQAVGQWP